MTLHSERRNFLREVCERRQQRMLKARWESATAMWADWSTRGVNLSERRAQMIYGGDLPGFFTFLQLVNAGYWPLYGKILEPIIQAGGEAALEAELNDRRKEVARRERELEELKQARTYRAAGGVSMGAEAGREHRLSDVGNVHGRADMAATEDKRGE